MKDRLRDIIFFVAVTGFVFTGLLCGCGREQTVILDTARVTGTVSASPMTGQAMEQESMENDSMKNEPIKKDSPSVAGKVYIWGEVKVPGVYEFYPDARIGDIVELAGGLTRKAAPGCVNLAAVVEDGQEIHIYDKSQWDALSMSGQSPGEASSGRTSPDPLPDQIDQSGSQALVNLNTATKEQLMTVPGIGEAKAEAILNFRSEQGAFSKIEDIMKISGIKEKMFQKIKNYITV